MATPNVANLAAKLFALDPKLTPGEAIEVHPAWSNHQRRWTASSDRREAVRAL
jgi:hypothetical protein